MYVTKANTKRVLPSAHRRTTSQLVQIAREGILEELGVILVFELSQEYKHLGDYVLIDGHHRREAAEKAGVDITVTVLQKPEDYEKVFEGYRRTPEIFEAMKRNAILDAIGYLNSGYNESYFY